MSFKPGPNPMVKAAVWDIFNKRGKDEAICKYCDPEVKFQIKKSCTSSMRTHAKTFHPDAWKKAEKKREKVVNPNSQTIKTAMKITQKYKFGSQVFFLNISF